MGSGSRRVGVLELLVGGAAVGLGGGSVGVSGPAMSLGGGAVLRGVTDASLRRLVVDLCSAVMHLG